MKWYEAADKAMKLWPDADRQAIETVFQAFNEATIKLFLKTKLKDLPEYPGRLELFNAIVEFEVEHQRQIDDEKWQGLRSIKAMELERFKIANEAKLEKAKRKYPSAFVSRWDGHLRYVPSIKRELTPTEIKAIDRPQK